MTTKPSSSSKGPQIPKTKVEYQPLILQGSDVKKLKKLLKGKKCKEFRNELLSRIACSIECSEFDDFRTDAKLQYAEEGRIEIDDNAIVSLGTDPGAYVMAWVWVDKVEEKDHGFD